MGARPGARLALPLEAQADVRVPASIRQRAITVMRAFIRIGPIIAAVILLLVGSLPGAAEPAGEGESTRAGWYLSAGAGAVRASNLSQEGWNRDTFCYPDSACFDQTPTPGVPGYRWRYDIGSDNGAGFDLSAGRFFGRARLELAVAQTRNGVSQMFSGIAYSDGTAIQPRPGGAVASNSRGFIDDMHIRSLSLDGYYDFPGAWGRISPYIGAGLGLASVEIAGAHFSTDYRDTSGAGSSYDPPLAFYNTVQNADLDDTVLIWRLHAGADYALSDRTSMGLKLSRSATGDFASTDAYDSHPMQAQDPGFAGINTFSGARTWTLTLTLRRRLGG